MHKKELISFLQI